MFTILLHGFNVVYGYKICTVLSDNPTLHIPPAISAIGAIEKTKKKRTLLFEQASYNIDSMWSFKNLLRFFYHYLPGNHVEAVLV